MGQGRSEKGYEFGGLSYETIGACIHVQRQLGVHCMEVDYQRALALAVSKRGLEYQREVEVPIVYEDVVSTKRRVDFAIWPHTQFVAPLSCTSRSRASPFRLFTRPFVPCYV